jgi:hypothetical protein
MVREGKTVRNAVMALGQGNMVGFTTVTVHDQDCAGGGCWDWGGIPIIERCKDPECTLTPKAQYSGGEPCEKS